MNFNIGLAKGLRAVCSERFGPDKVKGKKQEHLVEMLANEEDFKSTKPMLEVDADKRGDKIKFGVKFTPELMAIEAAYRDISRYMKIHNIEGCSKGFLSRLEKKT